MSNTPAKQRSASERLNDSEQALMSIFQALDNISRDMMLVKDAIKLLGNKTDAVVKASNLSDDTISALMVENNVAELKANVDRLIGQGILTAEAVVTGQSFVVLREVDDAGKVVNPRLQLSVGAIDPAIASKLIGGLVGQTVDVQEGKLKVEIMESYAIQTPVQAPAEALEAPAAEESASS